MLALDLLHSDAAPAMMKLTWSFSVGFVSWALVPASTAHQFDSRRT